MKNIELLAPAGSYECLLAALKSGADAIYVGGDKFGARAFAGNFSEEELKKAIDLVHLHEKKLFLTINTLIKEKELTKELYDYIYPLYKHGLDAVIVQDMGVLMFVKEHFPDLPIHASTQMTVTSIWGAKFLEKLGVERVVTSRELSLDEVQEITSNTPLEIESFVHGSLCYAYSGQCIYSSIIGGRSGNKGQCAQPCRLPFKVNGKTGHFMSLKDICTVEHIDKLIESGVYSFKIEGRMKKPEYVASVTSMYRKYIDLYLKEGSVNVSTKDMDNLRDVFSRGEFSSGYWLQKNGPEMVTFNKPSHTGVPILHAMNQVGSILKVKAVKELNKGDIIDIPNSSDNYTFGSDYKIGDVFELRLRKGVKVPKDALLYRTRNNKLLEQIDKNLSDNKLQQGITGNAKFEKGKPIQLTVSLGDVTITVYADEPQLAEKQSATKEQVLKQLNKMGTTPFYFTELNIVLDEGLFLPVQQLKELRRLAAVELENTIINAYRRQTKGTELNLKGNNSFISSLQENEIYNEDTVITALSISTKEQLLEVIKGHNFHRIYLDYMLVEELGKDAKEAITQLNSDIYLALPHIVRQKYLPRFQHLYTRLNELPFKGVLVRNIEEYGYLRNEQYTGEIILDHHIHIFNKYAQQFWRNEGVKDMTYSQELTKDEMSHLFNQNMELDMYAYATMMVSAQCIKKTTSSCTHQSDIVKLNDRMQVDFSVKSCCSYCYNLIYNYEPSCLFYEKEAMDKIAPSAMRLSLTIEGKQETRKILDTWEAFRAKQNFHMDTYTVGNFKRGIQ